MTPPLGKQKGCLKGLYLGLTRTDRQGSRPALTLARVPFPPPDFPASGKTAATNRPRGSSSATDPPQDHTRSPDLPRRSKTLTLRSPAAEISVASTPAPQTQTSWAS